MSSTNSTRGNKVGDPSPSVRAAWHRARGRRVVKTEIKNDEGKVVALRRTHAMNDGPSLKTWASEVAKSEAGTPLGDLCREWFFAKKGGINQIRTQANRDLAEIAASKSRAARKTGKTGKATVKPEKGAKGRGASSAPDATAAA